MGLMFPLLIIILVEVIFFVGSIKRIKNKKECKGFAISNLIISTICCPASFSLVFVGMSLENSGGTDMLMIPIVFVLVGIAVANIVMSFKLITRISPKLIEIQYPTDEETITQNKEFIEQLFLHTLKEKFEKLYDEDKISKEDLDKKLRLIERGRFELLDISKKEIEERKKCAEITIVNRVKEIRQEYLEEQNKYRKDYINSPRHKLSKWQLVSLYIGSISMLLAIVFSFAKLTAGMIPTYIIGLICLFVGIVLSLIKNRGYCKICGYKGEEIDSKVVDTNTKIERNIVTLETQKTTTNGHLVYDDKGNAYIEQLVTTTTYENKMKCSHCGNEWVYNIKKKS